MEKKSARDWLSMSLSSDCPVSSKVAEAPPKKSSLKVSSCTLVEQLSLIVVKSHTAERRRVFVAHGGIWKASGRSIRKPREQWE